MRGVVIVIKKQQGFTLIELVIVVIILGLIGAAAVPRFLDATDDARDASIEGVAGGFASAVGLARAQWELLGRPSVANAINYDGVNVFLSNEGYPTAISQARNATQMSATHCSDIFGTIINSSPSITASANGGVLYKYLATLSNETTGDICNYFLTSTLAATGNNLTAPADTTVAGSQGFRYNPTTGAVSVFKN